MAFSATTIIPPIVADKRDLMASLYKVTETVRAALLEALDTETLIALVETALNVILGHIPSDERQLRQLRRHREDLLRLTGAKTTQRERRGILAKTPVYRAVFDSALPALKAASARH